MVTIAAAIPYLNRAPRHPFALTRVPPQREPLDQSTCNSEGIATSCCIELAASAAASKLLERHPVRYCHPKRRGGLG